MSRPRRSRQGRSSRPRAGYSRAQRFPRDGYVAVGRTLITPAVARDLVAPRTGRLVHAEAAHAQASADLDEAVCALLSATKSERAFRAYDLWLHDSVDAHELACTRRLTLAEAELRDARASASRPVGERVAPPLVSLSQPRTWPNAAPGGTSPRRAGKRASWAFEVCLPVDVPASWLEPLPD